MEQTITLQDGRKLSYIEYGDPFGQPLILLHGTPGSRIWFAEDDPLAQKLGIRLIATDRPGFGLSDQQPNRNFIDYACDIEQLVDHLQLQYFSVLGVSGGGAFAAAIAYKLPERVKHCLLVSSATPFHNGKPAKDMSKENKIAFFLSKRLPFLMKLMSNAQRNMMINKPEKYLTALKQGGKHLPAWDNAFLQDDDILQVTLIQNQEAYRQGVEGTLYESQLLTKDWGFTLQDITVPLHIWHGEADTLSPISEMKRLTQNLPHANTHFITDGGHFLIENEQLWLNMLETVTK